MPFSVYPPVSPTPAGPFTFAPSAGGIGSLAGNGANGVLGRASTLASQVPTHIPGSAAARAILPGGGGLPTSLLPAGAGAEATLAAQGLRGAGASAGGRLGGFALRGLGSAEGVPAGLGFRGAMAAGRGALPGVLATSRLARGAAGLGSGLVADFAADKLFGTEDESIAQQAGRGFTRGAGWGVVAAPALAATGIGIAGLPLVAVAAGITGTIGAAMDVLDAGKWFGGGSGEDKEEAVQPDEIISTIFEVAQLDPGTQAEIMQQYGVLMAMSETTDDKELKAQMQMQALQTVGDLTLQSIGQRDQIAASASDTLALQAQARDIFEPLARDIESSSVMYADAMKGISGSLPEQYRGIAEHQALQQQYTGSRLADAYRAQAAITPVVDRLTQYQQDFNNYSAQQFSQALAQQAAGGSASLGPSATDVQAQLQAALG